MKSGERSNYYLSDAATSSAMVAIGLKKLAEECQRLGKKTAWLVTNTKQTINGIISDTIGQQAAKTLQRNMPVELSPGVRLTHYSEGTLPRMGDGSPILACYPSPKLLTRIDSMLHVPTLIVLPWVMEEIQSWVQTHGPVDILGKIQTTALSVSNPVVERALESLWAAINTSTGIGHSLDKHKAIAMFKILKAGKEAYTPAEVRSWLVRKGMSPRSADDIAAIAESPNKFRSAHGNAPAWREDILSLWRQEANEPDLPSKTV